MENVFEIKLFLKTEDDNIHIGSFMLDLNILLSERCKASSDLYLTVKNLRTTFYDIGKKKSENSLILISKLILIRSDLRLNEFETMNSCLAELFKNLGRRTKFLSDVENSKSNAKDFKKVLSSYLTEDYYDEIDSKIMALDIDENTIPENRTSHMDILINVFSNEDSFANYQEYSDLKQKAIEKNYIERSQKLKLRNNEKLFYKLSKKRLLEIVNLEDDSKEFIKDALNLYLKEYNSYIDFEIIKVDYVVENESEKNNIFLLDFFYFVNCLITDKTSKFIVGNEKNVLIPSIGSKEKAFFSSINNKNNLEEYNSANNGSIKLTVISAMRLTYNKQSKL